MVEECSLLVNEDNLYFDPPELSIQVFDGGDGVF